MTEPQPRRGGKMQSTARAVGPRMPKTGQAPEGRKNGPHRRCKDAKMQRLRAPPEFPATRIQPARLVWMALTASALFVDVVPFPPEPGALANTRSRTRKPEAQSPKPEV